MVENFKILEEKENPLFNRKEIKVSIEATVTPSHADVQKLICEKFSSQVEKIKIKKISGKFGSRTSIITANIYDSKESKEQTERKSKREIEESKKEEEKLNEESKPEEKKLDEAKTESQKDDSSKDDSGEPSGEPEVKEEPKVEENKSEEKIIKKETEEKPKEEAVEEKSPETSEGNEAEPEKTN